MVYEGSTKIAFTLKKFAMYLHVLYMYLMHSCICFMLTGTIVVMVLITKTILVMFVVGGSINPYSFQYNVLSYFGKSKGTF